MTLRNERDSTITEIQTLRNEIQELRKEITEIIKDYQPNTQTPHKWHQISQEKPGNLPHEHKAMNKKHQEEIKDLQKKNKKLEDLEKSKEKLEKEISKSDYLKKEVHRLRLTPIEEQGRKWFLQFYFTVDLDSEIWISLWIFRSCMSKIQH